MNTEGNLYKEQKVPIKDIEFIDNFIHFNHGYRGSVIDCLWKQFDRVEEGDKIAFLLEVYSVFMAMSEDIGRMFIALMKKKQFQEKALFYHYCQDIESNDWEEVYNILKTNELDDFLEHINLPQIAEFSNTPNYDRLPKKQDYFKEQMDKALRCLSGILVFREPKLFREVYNIIKHGMRFVVWIPEQKVWFISKTEHKSDSEVLSKGYVLYLKKEDIQVYVDEAKNVELSLGVILGWYYLLKFEVNDITVNNIFNGCLALFDNHFDSKFIE